MYTSNLRNLSTMLSRNIAFKHPQNVCMTYLHHLNLSLGFSRILLVGGLKAFIHGLYPDIYITSTSDVVHKLNKIMKENGCK